VAEAKLFPSLMDPMVAEALGAWIAVKFGCELGFTQVHLEGDSLNVVSILKKTGPCCTSLGHLIEDTRLWLQRLDPFCVYHVRRDANLVAHRVAKLAISQLLNEVWLEDCPSFLQDVIFT